VGRDRARIEGDRFPAPGSAERDGERDAGERDARQRATASQT
jgi:hypothetical protein